VTQALTVLLILGISAPHLLPLSSVSPAVAATIWLSALCLRALTVFYVALYLVLFLPNTSVFSAVTHWCWHTVLPLLATHMGLDGHRVGDAAAILPAFVLAFSLISVAVGVVRAARSVRALLSRSSLGQGPGDSLIVGGPDVLLAAAGITRPRVFVSAGALTTLDDEELAAGLDHERAHIARRHRFILVFAELCRSLARFLPGTRATLGELHFHLERDADHWALARRHDPYALASAICKAAASRATAAPGLVLLSGRGEATRRVDELIDGTAAVPGRALRRGSRLVAMAMACVVVVLVASVPATVAASTNQPPVERPRHCET
jgi:Zn-dependent protease with chaperone function